MQISRASDLNGEVAEAVDVAETERVLVGVLSIVERRNQGGQQHEDDEYGHLTGLKRRHLSEACLQQQKKGDDHFEC